MAKKKSGARAASEIERAITAARTFAMRRTPSKARVPDHSRKDPTVEKIAKMERQREERRRKHAEYKKEREAEQLFNEKMGRPGDIDFQRMVDNWRRDNERELAHRPNTKKICICVRKRPVNEKEVRRKDYDTVTCLNPKAHVHFPKLKIDGITKYLDNTDFRFDHTFSEHVSTEDIYRHAASPLVEFAVEGGRATVFAYGQTGSGKTYTMSGIMRAAAQDVFSLLAGRVAGRVSVYCSMFEIYGGRCQDLLNARKRLQVCEDGQGEVQVVGLEEIPCPDADSMLQRVEEGNAERTTHVTEMNDTSSRSHAIFQIALRDGAGTLCGKLSLIDLAGSERGADTKSHNRQRRLESAEINKSLLALKECIRALDGASSHVPYRASKLTLVLKDSFTLAAARTVMVACVSPAASSSDHTVNTLRYADRIKEKDADAPNLDAACVATQRVGSGTPSPATTRAPPPQPPVVTAVVEDAGLPSRDACGATRGVGAARRLSVRHSERVRHDSPGLGKENNRNATSGPGVKRDRGSASLGSHVTRRREAGEHDGETGRSKAGSARRGSADAHEDLQYLQRSLREQHDDDGDGDAAAAQLEATAELWEAGESLYEQEESLLNAHMNAIQENAEMLTEEGKLLARVQGEDVVDYDIDAYASRLDQILARKVSMIQDLRNQLTVFRQNLQAEEQASNRVAKAYAY